MCARADKKELSWQLPQGGIDEGETPAEAAKRELAEETGLVHVQQIVTLEKPVRYDFPNYILEAFKKINRKDIGQDQYYSLFYFSGSDDEIDFYTHPEEIELKAYQWVDIEKTTDLVVSFKREAYAEMVKAFKPIIENFHISN